MLFIPKGGKGKDWLIKYKGKCTKRQNFLNNGKRGFQNSPKGFGDLESLFFEFESPIINIGFRFIKTNSCSLKSVNDIFGLYLLDTKRSIVHT